MQTLYTTKEAAKYLGMKYASFRYYVFAAKRVAGEKKGNTLLFSKRDLDIFSTELKYLKVTPDENENCFLLTPQDHWHTAWLVELEQEIMDHTPPDSTLIGFRKTYRIRKGYPRGGKMVGTGEFLRNPMDLFNNIEKRYIQAKISLNDEESVIIFSVSPKNWQAAWLAKLEQEIMDHAPPGSALIGFRKTRQLHDRIVGIGKFHKSPVSLFAETEAESGQQIEIKIKIDPTGLGARR